MKEIMGKNPEAENNPEILKIKHYIQYLMMKKNTDDVTIYRL